MTITQALAPLLIPAHWFNWYVSTAAQMGHLIIGVGAFAALAWLDQAVAMKRHRPPMPTHLLMLAAMLGCAGFEALSLAVYSGSALDRITNAAFMTAGCALAWAIWSHRWRLMGWAVLAAVAALLINAAERL